MTSGFNGIYCVLVRINNFVFHGQNKLNVWNITKLTSFHLTWQENKKFALKIATVKNAGLYRLYPKIIATVPSPKQKPFRVQRQREQGPVFQAQWPIWITLWLLTILILEATTLSFTHQIDLVYRFPLDLESLHIYVVFLEPLVQMWLKINRRKRCDSGNAWGSCGWEGNCSPPSLAGPTHSLQSTHKFLH